MRQGFPQLLHTTPSGKCSRAFFLPHWDWHVFGIVRSVYTHCLDLVLLYSGWMFKGMGVSGHLKGHPAVVTQYQTLAAFKAG